MAEMKKYLRHLVLFPCPLQGHINPMLQLATVLHSQGFSITVVHTKFNSPNPSNFPNFNFESIDDGLSQDEISGTRDVIALLMLINQRCFVPFRDVLGRLLVSEKGHDDQQLLPCLISDAVMHFTQAVAKHFNLPRMVLRTSSAVSFVAFVAYPLLRQKGYLPVKDPQSEMPVDEIWPLRIKDLPTFLATDQEILHHLVLNMVNQTRASSGAIWNTFHSLEQSALVKLEQDLQVPIFATGPLHKCASGSSSSLLVQDRSCIAWLDRQEVGSVIYVSLGSLAVIDRAGLVETAWGLANSEHPFLWVIRPGSVHGQEWAELPEEFADMTKDRGLIVKWAPQDEVLAHPAVGAFWTHSGWNSTMESICEGVPMLCWPYFGDQKVNARNVSHVWKLGLQLENGLERGEIERTIKKLMVGVEAEEIRERIKVLKAESIKSQNKGGSSFESFQNLKDYILSL